MYQILTQANRYHWMTESSIEPEDNENDTNLTENENDNKTQLIIFQTGNNIFYLIVLIYDILLYKMN